VRACAFAQTHSRHSSHTGHSTTHPSIVVLSVLRCDVRLAIASAHITGSTPLGVTIEEEFPAQMRCDNSVTAGGGVCGRDEGVRWAVSGSAVIVIS